MSARVQQTTEFRIGDTVRCIDDEASFGRLYKGQIYKVEAAYDGTPVVIARGSYCTLERFELVEKAK